MNGWSKEDLEEMCGDDIIEQLAFVSGCHQHQLCNGNPSGWIIPEESLRKFAELIIRECISVIGEENYTMLTGKAYCTKLKRHFGIK